ncbi:MAG: heparinase II/III family protein [Rhodospirillales bacterium]
MTDRTRRCLLATAAAGLLAGCATGSAGAAPTDLSALPPHPRLFATPSTVARARAHLAADPMARRRRDDLVRLAERLLTEAPTSRQFEPRRPVLLPTSRRVLDRIQLLGVLDALAGGVPRYVERALAEVRAAIDFPDWNPSHFLDVAEMAHAVGLAYDWFHDRMDPDLRTAVRTALVEKALRPGLEDFARRRFWTTATHNWNLVCCGGLVVAALAVGAEAREAGEVLERCVAAARAGFSSYGPDGGWDEGPAYWQYATVYAGTLLAALEGCGLSDGGLIDSPGFARTGDYAAHLSAPSGRVFNFGDGGERMARTPHLLWLAARIGDPAAAFAETARTDWPAPHGLLWAGPAPPPPTARAARFRHVETAAFRGAWDDPRATWFAIKGGDTAANHGSLDLGTFVAEFAGERFALDLGPDDYSLPGYFDRRRRSAYYRNASAGQNVLTVGGADQRLGAKAAIASFGETDAFAFAVVDLDAATPDVRHRRGGALVDRRHVVIVDEVAPARAATLEWRMHTRATVEVTGGTARLTQGGAAIFAYLLAPADGAFAVEDATAPAPENPNTGIRRLMVRLPAAEGARRIAILLTPDANPPATAVAAAARPLASWG